MREDDVWEAFCEELKGAGKVLQAARMQGDELTLAEGYRHLARMIRMGFEMTYEYADAEYPRIAPAFCDSMLSEGVTSDARYHHAFIDGSATYHVTGRLGTAPLIEFGVYAGKIGLQDASRQVGFLTERELTVGEDGSFELVLGPEEHPGNWIHTTPDVSYLFIRQYAHDWSSETSACFEIRREGIEGCRPPARLDEVRAALRQTAAFVQRAPLFWTGLVDRRAEGEPNVFQTIAGEQSASSTTMPVGHQFSFGFFRLAPGEALVVEFRPSSVPYWGLDLTNYWFEPLSFGDHRSHVNNRTAVYEPDGSVRIVIADGSNEAPNRLDTLGHQEGTMIFRWSRSRLPIPPLATKVVTLGEL